MQEQTFSPPPASVPYPNGSTITFSSGFYVHIYKATTPREQTTTAESYPQEVADKPADAFGLQEMSSLMEEPRNSTTTAGSQFETSPPPPPDPHTTTPSLTT